MLRDIGELVGFGGATSVGGEQGVFQQPTNKARGRSPLAVAFAQVVDALQRVGHGVTFSRCSRS